MSLVTKLNQLLGGLMQDGDLDKAVTLNPAVTTTTQAIALVPSQQYEVIAISDIIVIAADNSKDADKIKAVVLINEKAVYTASGEMTPFVYSLNGATDAYFVPIGSRVSK